MNDQHRETRHYYNEFAKWYERDRHKGYHKFLDELESSIVRPYAKDKEVLEAGCGTGLIMMRLVDDAKRLVGVDLSEGMLERAKQKGLDVLQADLSELPFEDDSFDTVYSFKVLAHVEKIEQALAEMDRVVRPGGHLVLEFYNTMSLRFFVKKLKQPGKISETRTENDVYTRFDTLPEILRMAPSHWKLKKIRGARVFTPYTKVFEWPVVSLAVQGMEMVGSYLPLSLFAGFLILVFENRKE